MQVAQNACVGGHAYMGMQAHTREHTQNAVIESGQRGLQPCSPVCTAGFLIVLMHSNAVVLASATTSCCTCMHVPLCAL